MSLSDLRVHQVGATVMAIGLSGALEVAPARGTAGWQVQVLSGGSSGVAFMQAAGAVTCSQGFLIGSQSISIDGPARFYLAAQGTTALVSLLVKYSAGYSLFP